MEFEKIKIFIDFILKKSKTNNKHIIFEKIQFLFSLKNDFFHRNVILIGCVIWTSLEFRLLNIKIYNKKLFVMNLKHKMKEN